VFTLHFSTYPLVTGCASSEPFIKLLYVTPERIVKGGRMTREILQELYQNEMLARFIIDEAHCVSSWGHDFRKDYAALHILKTEFPEAPIVALTATARKKVADDTIKTLCIPNCRRFHTGLYLMFIIDIVSDFALLLWWWWWWWFIVDYNNNKDSTVQTYILK
jgi:superfamily II DNA helicase RecQ